MTSVIWFIFFTGWAPTGVPVPITSQAIYDTKDHCDKRRPEDRKMLMERGYPALDEGVCRAVPAKPAGLPEVQPHVPGKIEA